MQRKCQSRIWFHLERFFVGERHFLVNLIEKSKKTFVFNVWCLYINTKWMLTFVILLVFSRFYFSHFLFNYLLIMFRWVLWIVRLIVCRQIIDTLFGHLTIKFLRSMDKWTLISTDLSCDSLSCELIWTVVLNVKWRINDCLCWFLSSCLALSQQIKHYNCYGYAIVERWYFQNCNIKIKRRIFVSSSVTIQNHTEVELAIW